MPHVSSFMVTMVQMYMTIQCIHLVISQQKISVATDDGEPMSVVQLAEAAYKNCSINQRRCIS